MEIVWMIGLSMAAVFILIRYLLLKIAIRDAKEQLRFIYHHKESNLQLKLSLPDRDLEGLLGQMNQSLNQQQEDRILAEKQEKKLRQEIANISHDLRTPLTSILGYLDLMQQTGVPEIQQKQYLEIVKKKSVVLKSLIESFYGLSCIESDDYAIKKQEVNLYRLICEILFAFYHDLEEKKIDVKLELKEDIKPILLDEHAMVRVITNILQNVLRYASHDLVIHLEQDEESTRIRFENDAGNMNRDMVTKIFDRTYTGSESRSDGHMGIGLTIAKRLIQKQGGTIKADYENDRFGLSIEFQ